MDLIAKLFALGLVGAIGTIVLKKADKGDIAVVLDLALIVIALGLVYQKIDKLMDAVINMFGGVL